MRPNNQMVITGIILQEVLQGIRNSHSLELTSKLIRRLPVLSPGVSTHLQAAELFKELRRKGNPLSTVDVLIAALAIEHRTPLFTLDANFKKIAKHTSLELF